MLSSDKPFISVVIPVFNRCKLFRRALESVLNQTFRDFEVIVIDDGSTQNLYDYCPELLSGCIYRKNSLNRGVSFSRNRGVDLSCGEWIAFLDSDDVWHKDKLQKETAWLMENPGIRILQSREIWIRGGKRVNPPDTHKKRGGDIFIKSLKRCMITVSSVLIEKNLFTRLGGFNEALPACEDYDLWLRIAYNHEVGLVDDYLITRYGGHSDQLSTGTKIIDRFRIRSLLDLIKKPSLSAAQKKEAEKELSRKAMIVAKGCKKRGKEKEYERFRKIAKDYEQRLY